MIAVVDSSVVVKWFVDEKDAGLALDLRLRPLAAPDLLLAECANVFWKKARRGEYTSDDAALALRAIERAPILISPSIGLTGRAFDLALRLEHPAYDCFYLALCEQLALPFITADDKLQRKVASASSTAVSVLTLREWKSALNAA
ncbi:hypothetical protein BH10PSE2_BH10PSE2_25160 [soil metagenome]